VLPGRREITGILQKGDCRRGASEAR
jgi:hypothetical protein